MKQLCKLSVAITLILVCVSEPVFSATLSSDFPSIGPINGNSLDELEATMAKAEKDLQSGKNNDILTALEFIRNNLPALLAKNLLKPETLKNITALLASKSSNIQTSANRLFEQHLPALFNNSAMTTSTLNEYSEKVYQSEQNFIVFLNLLNGILKNNMITKDYLSSEYGYNLIDGVIDPNPNVHALSTKILKSYGADLTTKGILEQSHVSRFIMVIKDLPPEYHSDYLSVFQTNLSIWVKSGLVSKADVQSILSTTARFGNDFHDRIFSFMTKPETMNTLQSLGMFDRSWVESLKKDITSGNGAAKQNALDMIAFFLPAFIKSGTLNGTDYRELWKVIQSDMETFDDPFAIHKKNYRLLSSMGWFVRDDYEKLLLTYDNQSVHVQMHTLKYFDTVYDWLRLRNWLGMSELSKAIESPTGKTLELRKLGFKPLAKAVLSDDSQYTKLEEQKVSFVGSHIDSILDNDLFTSDHISSFIKKLQSSNPDVYFKAIDVVDNGLSKWNKLGTLQTYHLNEMFNHANMNSDKTAALVRAFDNNFEGIYDLFTKDMINTMTLYLDSGNSEVEDATKSFFSNHRETIESQKLANYVQNENLKEHFKVEKKPTHKKENGTTWRYSKNYTPKPKLTTSRHKDNDEELIGD